jgi:transcription antitermination factor NusG
MDRIAMSYLRRAGHNPVYFSIESRKFTRRGQPLLIERAMFPSYLFIRDDEAAASVLGCVGVSHYLTMGGVPTPCPPGFVEQLAAQLDWTEAAMKSANSRQTKAKFPRFVMRVEPTRPLFNLGQPVRLRDNSSAGGMGLFPATFKKMSGTARCVILFSIFGQQTAAEVDVGRLVAADDPHTYRGGLLSAHAA